MLFTIYLFFFYFDLRNVCTQQSTRVCVCVCVCVCVNLLCAFCSFFTSVCTNHLVLVVRWKGSHHLLWMTWQSSILNHYFSRTSFLNIFYQKMIACNLVTSVYPIIPWKQAGTGGSSQPRLQIMQWSRWTEQCDQR
jgi:hypothetical protein